MIKTFRNCLPSLTMWLFMVVGLTVLFLVKQNDLKHIAYANREQDITASVLESRVSRLEAKVARLERGGVVQR